MHIPDGYLGPATYAAMFGVTVPFWAVASWKLNRTLKTRQAPYLALGAAFSFVIMMFNIPVLGGTTGHAAGTALIAILLGPWAAIIAVSVALVIQALLFGDGGITAIGANCFNIAVVGALSGYGVYRLIAAGSDLQARRRLIAAGIAAYISLNSSAFFTALELGLQPLIEISSAGRPLYAPYPLSVAIPAMMFGHVFFFGLIEAAITVLVVRYFQNKEPEMLKQHMKNSG
jgi:cobalt/nickel transport system permease protein